MNNDNFNNNSNDLEFEELENFNDNEIDSDGIYLAQRPGRQRPGRPEQPGFPVFPGFPQPPMRPGRPEQPEFPEPPINITPPMMAPPTVVPQLPRGLVIPIPGTSDYNVQYGNVDRTNNIASQFRFCLNRFTFIWLWNGRSFWFYPTFIGRRSAEGFIWTRNGWRFDRFLFPCPFLPEKLNLILYFLKSTLLFCYYEQYSYHDSHPAIS